MKKLFWFLIIIILIIILIFCFSKGEKWENVRITNNARGSIFPTVVWNTDGFGIFYSDYRDGNEAEIYFTKADKKGNKLVEDKRISYQASLISYYPDVLLSGDNFDLTWVEYSRNQEQSSVIMHALFDKNGNLIGDIATSTGIGRTDMVYVGGRSSVWTGTNYGNVFCYSTNNGAQSDCDFYLTDQNGEIISQEIKFTSGLNNARGGGHVGWDGSDFGVVWHDYDPDGVRQIYFTRFSDSGEQNITFESPAQFWGGMTDYNSTQITSLSGGPTGDYAVTPRIVWADNKYGVVWSENNSRVAFVTIDNNGSKTNNIDYVTTDGSSIGSAVDISWNGSEFGVVWHDGRDGNEGEEIYFATSYSCWIKDIFSNIKYLITRLFH